jgi:hypothetical protein
MLRSTVQNLAELQLAWCMDFVRLPAHPACSKQATPTCTQLLKRHSVTPAADGKPLRLSSVMSIGGSTPNDVVREIAVLKKLDHPNIVKLREVRAET